MSIITRSGCCRTNCCNRSHVWNLDQVVDFITKKNKNKKRQQQQKVVESSRKHAQFEEREENGYNTNNKVVLQNLQSRGLD